MLVWPGNPTGAPHFCPNAYLQAAIKPCDWPELSVVTPLKSPSGDKPLKVVEDEFGTEGMTLKTPFTYRNDPQPYPLPKMTPLLSTPARDVPVLRGKSSLANFPLRYMKPCAL